MSVFNHSLSFSWIKVKALRVRLFFFCTIWYFSLIFLLFYFIRVELNSVHPKDAMGPVFACPTKVL